MMTRCLDFPSCLKLLRSTVPICCPLLAQLTAHRVTAHRRMMQILAILQRYAATVQFAPSYTKLSSRASSPKDTTLTIIAGDPHEMQLKILRIISGS